MAKLETLAADQTVVRPPEAVRRQASVQDRETACRGSVDDNKTFWADAAKRLAWTKPWHTVREFDEVRHRWFLGGETNITLNALERNLDAGRADKTAYLRLGENGDEKRSPCRELYAQVRRVANGLGSLGVRKGDRMVIYPPLTLESQNTGGRSSRSALSRPSPTASYR